MSKGLEAALKIIKIKCHPNSNPSPLVDEALNTIEQALQRLDKYEDVLKEDRFTEKFHHDNFNYIATCFGYNYTYAVDKLGKLEDIYEEEQKNE